MRPRRIVRGVSCDLRTVPPADGPWPGRPPAPAGGPACAPSVRRGRSNCLQAKRSAARLATWVLGLRRVSRPRERSIARFATARLASSCTGGSHHVVLHRERDPSARSAAALPRLSRWCSHIPSRARSTRSPSVFTTRCRRASTQDDFAAAICNDPSTGSASGARTRGRWWTRSHSSWEPTSSSVTPRRRASGEHRCPGGNGIGTTSPRLAAVH